MEYLLTLKNGEKRRVSILKKPYFACRSTDVGEDVYKTAAEVKTDKRFTIIDINDPHYLYEDSCGFIRDEATMFNIYKSLRNDIVRLVKTDQDGLLPCNTDIQDVIDRIAAYRPPDKDFVEFDKSREKDPVYCVEWGMMKQKHIERQIYDRMIQELSDLAIRKDDELTAK